MLPSLKDRIEQDRQHRVEVARIRAEAKKRGEEAWRKAYREARTSGQNHAEAETTAWEARCVVVAESLKARAERVTLAVEAINAGVVQYSGEDA